MDELKDIVAAAQGLSGPAGAYLWAKAVGAWVEIVFITTFWFLLLAGAGWVSWNVRRINREGE
jgi:hypothetical protein